MSMQTPERIAADVYPHGTADMYLVEECRTRIAEAIRRDRAQRPAAERWEIVDDLYPQNVATFVCDQRAAEEIAYSWGSIGGTISTFTARPAGS